MTRYSWVGLLKMRRHADSQRSGTPTATIANTLLARSAPLAHGSHPPPVIFTMVSIFARAADIRHARVVVARRGHRKAATLCSRCQCGPARSADGVAQGARLDPPGLREPLICMQVSTFARSVGTHLAPGAAGHHGHRRTGTTMFSRCRHGHARCASGTRIIRRPRSI